MKQFLIFLIGAAFGGAAIFLYVLGYNESPSLEARLTYDVNSKAVIEKTSGVAPILTSDITSNANSSVSSQTNKQLVVTPRQIGVAKAQGVDGQAIVHPDVSKLMFNWADKERQGYWKYLSSAFNMPRENYTREGLLNTIQRMPPAKFEKFLFEVTRDRNLLESYRLDIQSIAIDVEPLAAKTRAIELRQRLSSKLISQLNQTKVITLK